MVYNICTLFIHSVRVETTNAKLQEAASIGKLNRIMTHTCSINYPWSQKPRYNQVTNMTCHLSPTYST